VLTAAIAILAEPVMRTDYTALILSQTIRCMRLSIPESWFQEPYATVATGRVLPCGVCKFRDVAIDLC
jgi:hypothetical protein